MVLRRILLLSAIGACASLACADPVPLAPPVPLDMSVEPGGGSGYVNDAYFAPLTGTSGTGLFPAFVRINNNTGLSMGFNTSFTPFQFDEVGGHTHDLTVGELPVVGFNGVAYFELLLDINEPVADGSDSRYLALEEVKIYTSPTGGNHLSPGYSTPPTATQLDALGTLRYDLDGLGDTAVLMNSNVIGGGSGNMDVRMLVPVANILTPDVTPDHYIYVWSMVGGDREDPRYPGREWIEEATFEEWAVNPNAATLPEDGDWGDLPDNYLTTREPADPPLNRMGAVHWLGFNEWLGPGKWTQVDPDDPTSTWVNPSWDGEEEGVPTSRADGDDRADSDDEDGVEYFVGAAETVAVTISVRDYDDAVRYHGSDIINGQDGLLHLDAWWDKNADGEFYPLEPGDPGYDAALDEHVVRNRTYDPSSAAWLSDPNPDPNIHVDMITIPGYAPSQQAPYLRWRLNYGNPNLSWGESQYGEVEDYYIIPEPATIGLLVVPVALLIQRRRRRRK